jgi:hypothetical protein
MRTLWSTVWPGMVQRLLVENLIAEKSPWSIVPDLALSPIPVLALVLALCLETLDIVASRIAEILGSVGTIAIVLL